MKNLGLIAAIYAFVVSAIFGITNPLFEAPDEPAHLRYVNFVVANKTLPNQLVPRGASHGEGHQHPLYYIGAGVVTAIFNGGLPIPMVEYALDDPNRGAPAQQEMRLAIEEPRGRSTVYVLRVFGAFLVALLVWRVYRLSQLLAIDPLWPTILVATLPQLLFIGSSISNDGLTALLCALAITSTVGASLENTSKGWIKAGLWTGLAFLAKKSALILFPAGLLLLLLTRKPGQGKNALWYAGLALLLATPILIRNQFLYGDPLANQMELQTLQGLVTPRSLGDRYFVTDFPMMLASSFVGLFGWTAVQVPMRIVAVYWLMLLPGLLISVKELARRPQTIYLGSIVVLNLIALIHYNLSFTQAQGRLLFPSLAAFAALWGVGMTRLTKDWPRQRYNLVAGGLIAAFVMLDVYGLMLNYSFHH